MLWFQFDGQRSDISFPYLKVLDIRRSILPAISDHLIKVPGRPGAYDMGREVEHLTFEVEVLIEAEDIPDLRNKVRQLAAWLDTEEVKELIFSEEDGEATPDGAPRKYMGRLTDKTDLEELIRYGKGTLTFLCPDPYAEGRTQTATIGGVGRAEDTPADWNTAAGLADVVSDESGDLILDKQGADLSGSVKSAQEWTNTTGPESSNIAVVEGADDSIQLAVSGSDFHVAENQIAHFNEAGDIRTDVRDDDGLTIKLPDWIINYEFTSLLEASQDGYHSINDVMNHPEGVYVTDTTRDNQFVLYEGDHVYAKASYSMNEGGTHVFCAKSDGHFGYIVANRTQRYSVQIPSTGGRFAWFWFVFDWTSASLYKDGELVGTYTPADNTSYRPSWRWWTSKATTGWGIIRKDLFIQEKLTPPAFYSGSYISSEYDLSAVKRLGSSWIKYNGSTYKEDITGHQIRVATTVYDAGTPEEEWVWHDIPDASGAPIPGLPQDLSGKRLRYKVELRTQDPGYGPTFYSCDLKITSGYATSGVYESTPIDLSTVVTAKGEATLSVGQNVPEGTNLVTQVGLADAEEGPYTFRTVEPGDPIPGIDTGMDLSGKWMKVRIELSRDLSVNATPKVFSYHYEVPSAYKPSGMREEAGVDLTPVGPVKTSKIEWQETLPSDAASIVVETQLVPPDGELDPEGWKPVQNGGPIPDIEPGMVPEGYTLYVRQKLTTTDVSQTPRLHRLNWNVSPEFRNEGSAPSFAVYTATFTSDTNTGSFKLLHVESGKYVLIKRNFKAGDVLVIDTYRGLVKLNGANIMKDVAIASDFFPLASGDNNFIVTPNENVTVRVDWTERWK